MIWHENCHNLVLSSEDEFIMSCMSNVGYYIPVSQWYSNFFFHYNNLIMGVMVSQITSLTIVYSRRRSKKTPKLRVTGLCAGNSPVTGEFRAQMASNAENVSIWWRHHVLHGLCRQTNSWHQRQAKPARPAHFINLLDNVEKDDDGHTE